MSAEFRQCEKTKADGGRCRGRALPGRPECAFHDDTTQAAQAEGRRAGGRRRSQPAAVLADFADDTPLATMPDVTAFLATVARKTVRGDLDAKVANSVTQTCAVLLRALLPDETGRQIGELQRQLDELRGQRHGDPGATEATRGPDAGGGPAGGRAPGQPVPPGAGGGPGDGPLGRGDGPDPWQAALLRTSPPRTLLLCSRQSGKSQTSAGLALKAALLEPGSLILLLSPPLRQSGELFRKVLDLYRRTGRPVPSMRPKDSALRLELVNGSRIESLPGTEGTVRSFSSVRLLVIDEAARVPDSLYYAVRPMLAVSGGSLIALSSAWAKLGWFYEAWVGDDEWNRVKVTALECPRIKAAFLREEERALGPRWFRMEYLCEFTDAIDALFTEEDVRAALANDLQPLFGG